MTKQTTKHTESFKIRANEVDAEGNCTLPAICSLFQEIAGNHALLLNFDITQLHEQNLTWVLHRMDIKIDRYPEWRETITIETWPAAGDALRAYRNYRIFGENGEQIGRSLSYWMMINMETRRPARMPKEVLDLRLSDIDHVIPVKTTRLKPFDEADTEIHFTVRKSDLDMNRHVNNARYVEWMLETYPDNQASQIHEIDIIFMQESIAGDKIISQQTQHNSHTKHKLKNQNGTVLAIAECS
ncbi:MAG: acyl-ACP thioesterase domain-containing protein [Balneolaceae bacterium]